MWFISTRLLKINIKRMLSVKRIEKQSQIDSLCGKSNNQNKLRSNDQCSVVSNIRNTQHA